MMEPPRGGMSFAREAMLKKLRAKARKYRCLDAPYLIALNSLTMAGDDLDVEQALYGPQVVHFHIQNPGSAELGRIPQGLWQRGAQTSYSRVTGTLVATDFGINAVGKTWPRLGEIPRLLSPSLAFELPWPTGTGDLQRNVIEKSDSTVDPARSSASVRLARRTIRSETSPAEETGLDGGCRFARRAKRWPSTNFTQSLDRGPMTTRTTLRGSPLRWSLTRSRRLPRYWPRLPNQRGR